MTKQQQGEVLMAENFQPSGEQAVGEAGLITVSSLPKVATGLFLVRQSQALSKDSLQLAST